MDQQTSTAGAFFVTHKDLFQYDKYIGNSDPFQNECAYDGGDSGAPKSFLEQYRELDRCRSIPEPRFTLIHPPTLNYPKVNPIKSATVSPPAFVTLQSTASNFIPFNRVQHEPIQSGNSNLRCPQPSSPDRMSTSAAKNNQTVSLQQQQSPVKVPVEPKQNVFILPALAGLLIDRETRAAASAHKSWDEAHKIEVLTGGKCVGRVRATSRNIPESIRMRLRASAIVSVRRERLYDLLCQDYEDISKHYT
ncbi:unnamed protein product [Phytophthora fragariaefolia]|uniref:Unnamed protein product n=1 Tax=Phytophthora fragariaefolia TaxID=1490495 RepID=A0A9W6TYV2_9STRA|nr:unnamed protein product [Phytophthora fragariaefolia]